MTRVQRWAPALAGLAALAVGGNWLWSNRHHLLGPEQVTIAQGEAVDDIRMLDRLVVFRAYLTATTTTHEIGWFTQAALPLHELSTERVLPQQLHRMFEHWHHLTLPTDWD